ncbi:MAG: putative acetyltransferase [Bacteroidia bacterium]|jgi:putative acetyltransferase
MQNHQIMEAQKSDIPSLIEVFETGISQAAKADYSPLEIQSWLETAQIATRWSRLIEEQYVLIVLEGNKVVGFGSLKGEDYVDFIYVHGQHLRKGIAQRVLDALISKAVFQNVDFLCSDVSLTAKPFFEKNGFKVIHKNENQRGNEVLINFRMRKALATV